MHDLDLPHGEVKDRTAEQDRRVNAIQRKLDKLDEAFLYSDLVL
jgi:hypothetical protein